MRIARAIGALIGAKLSRWDRAWSQRATPIDNAALAALVAAATYKLLTVLW